MKTSLIGLGLLTLTMAPAIASAENIDLDGSEESQKRQRTAKAVEIDRNVREIERGLYSKANVGAMLYLLNHPAPITNPVHSIGLGVGKDFVDREKMSMAWEVTFLQTVHNGISYIDQLDYVPNPLNYFQGDTRGFALLGGYEFTKYPSRRFGVGVKLSAGVMGMPVQMDQVTYETVVVDSTWGLTAAPNHGKVYIPVGGGPTFEYYTKLAHFSVGADVDVLYIVGWDLGVNPTGYVKYTF